jgi:hypothetical protein
MHFNSLDEHWQLTFPGPETKYFGHNVHQADALLNPYARNLPRAKNDKTPEARVRKFSPCLVEIGGQVVCGTLDKGSSWARFVADDCFSMPTCGLRFKTPHYEESTGKLHYEEWDYEHVQRVSNYLDWDLNMLESLHVKVFHLRNDKQLAAKLSALVMTAGLSDPDSFNMHHDKPTGRRENFARITIKRNASASERKRDFSLYLDAPEVDWSPASCTEHAKYEAYRPTMPSLETIPRSTMNKIKEAEEITIWVAIFEQDLPLYHHYARIINELIRQGGNDKPCTDMWMSLHPRYPSRMERDGEHGKWEAFLSKDFALDQKKRQWPERQPWLQIAGTDNYATVSDPVVPRTRYPGIVQYEQTMIPASLFELEQMTLAFEEQYNEDNVYYARFEKKGDYAVVHLRTIGEQVETRHDQEQLNVPQGTKVSVHLEADKPDGDAWDAAWEGPLSRALHPDDAFQMVFSCAIPPKYTSSPFPSHGTVKIRVLVTDHQADLQLKALSAVAAMARFKDAPLDKHGRRKFQARNLICGDLVETLSPDFIQEWQGWADLPRKVYNEDDVEIEQDPSVPNVAPADKASILHEVQVTIPADLNPQQAQAYWLFLRGCRAGTLALEGFPGTGKSKTISAIIVALMAMERRVLLVAQSNTGVDAVFKKVTGYLEKNHPDWLQDKVVRMGANTIEDGLRLQLENAGGSIDDELLRVQTNIDLANVKYTVAAKSAKWMLAHPDHEVTRNNDVWKSAKEARQQSSNPDGKVNKPKDATMGQSAAKSALFTRAVKPNQVLLLGATAAASHELSANLGFHADAIIFDELSQCDEATFMIPIADQQYCKALMVGGDTKQLGPVIQSTNKSPYWNIRAMSPLKRLQLAYHDRVTVFLYQNYRSHPEIIAAPSKVVYGGKMVSGHPWFPQNDLLWKTVTDVLCNNFGSLFREKIEAARDTTNETRAWWVCPRKAESIKVGNSTSSWNPLGASFVVLLAKSLRDGIGHGSNISVISMYGEDVAKIRKALASEYSDIKVRTVDSFQGEEDDIVIVHFVAAQTPYYDPMDKKWTLLNPMGFVSNMERMNVAATRAKEFSFLVGNSNLWRARIYEATKEPKVMPQDYMGCPKYFVRSGTNATYQLQQEMFKAGQWVSFNAAEDFVETWDPNEDYW